MAGREPRGTEKSGVRSGLLFLSLGSFFSELKFPEVDDFNGELFVEPFREFSHFSSILRVATVTSLWLRLLTEPIAMFGISSQLPSSNSNFCRQKWTISKLFSYEINRFAKCSYSSRFFLDSLQKQSVPNEPIAVD